MTILRNLYRLLSPRERRQALWLLPLMTLTALLEVAGVASVIPFLTLVADPSALESQATLSSLFDLGGFSSPQRFLIAIGVAMFFLIVGSNLLNTLTTWSVLRFSWMRNHSLGLRLLRGYLGKPYEFYLERHSADLGKNLIVEAQQVVSRTLVPAMQMIAKSIAALGVVALLFWFDPRLASVTVLLLGGAYGGLFLLIRRRQSRLGKQRADANTERFEIAADAFGGIKELKLLGREASVVDRFFDPSYRYAAATAENAVIGQVPRYLFEALAFGGIVLMVLYFLGTGQNLQSIVPTLGLYAFGAYRLMPSLQMVFLSLTNIRFNSVLLERLLEDLPRSDAVYPAPAEVPLPLEQSIQVRDLSFRYPRAKDVLFDGLNLELEARNSYAFVGETGSGKSTLVDLILGLLDPDGGSIDVDGRVLKGEVLRRWQRNIGYVPQSIFLANQTISRNIAFGLADDKIDPASVQRAARAAHIHDFIVEELPNGYETMVGERGVRLSGGQRQRIGIARALYNDPQVIVFDEATSSLDSVTEEQVVSAIRELAENRTIITIAHRLSTVRHCNRIFLLAAGEIVDAGSYDDLIRDSSHFRAFAAEREA